jgi:hypothetical protein
VEALVRLSGILRALEAGMHGAAWLLILLAAGCKKEPAGDGYEPDLACPGDPACPDADGQLQAGVARLSLEPACYEDWDDVAGDASWSERDDTFRDCGCDKLCPGDDGYATPDEGEGDGVFQASWVAGSQSGRAAISVRPPELGLRGEGDGIYVTALVLRKGGTSIAILSADTMSFMHDDVLALREEVRARGLDVDHVVWHSTHTHSSPDLLGLWGQSTLETGYDPKYAAQVRTTATDAVEQALSGMKSVEMTVGSLRPSEYSADKGVSNVVGDTRDPWVIEDSLGVVRLADKDSGDTVATLVNWNNHPETAAFDHLYLSSDYVHTLRKTIEEGAVWNSYTRPGVGGLTVYLNGTVGGMMTSLHIEVTDPDGNVWAEDSWEKADANGQLVGEMALDAIEAAEPVSDPELSFRYKKFYLRIDNIGLQAFSLMGIVNRSTYNWDPEADITVENTPEIESEVDLVNLGPVQLLTLPGEPLPEMAVGGYDGSQVHTPGQPLIDPNNTNPPDLATAPEGPYTKDRMTGEHRWIVGLGNDHVGYLIPEWEFLVHSGAPYLLEADGDHYEETVSLGPDTVGRLDEEVQRLVDSAP